MKGRYKMSDISNMYEVYTWCAWGFGYWAFRGFHHTEKEALESIKNRRLSTYIIAKNREIVVYHNCGITRGYNMTHPRNVTYTFLENNARNRQLYENAY